MTKKILPFLLFAGMLLLIAPFQPAQGAVADWNKGVSMLPRWDGDFGTDTFRQSVDRAADAQANTVTLVIPYYQSNIHTVDIHRGWNTPTDDSLRSAIDYIHDKGMKVNLKMHLDTYDGQWRANIHPGDRDGWFRNYSAMLSHYAGMGAAYGVEQFTIGTELISMTDPAFNGTNTDHWRVMIGQVREDYSGTLTYSANWGNAGWTDEKNHIVFWDALDHIGISAYFPLSSGDHTPESLRREWQK